MITIAGLSGIESNAGTDAKRWSGSPLGTMKDCQPGDAQQASKSLRGHSMTNALMREARDIS